MKIAVVGCGIGGLAAASFLSENGHEVIVFDQFKQATAIGSGLVIQPIGFAILKKLGIAKEALAKGACGYHMIGLESDSKRVVLDVSYGKEGGENFGLGIHRASLFDILLKCVLQRNVSIESDSKVIASHISADKRFIQLESAEEKGPFDLVVDSSGANSLLSPLSIPKRSRELDFGAIWATVNWPTETSLKYNQLEQRYQKAHHMIGVLPIGSMPNETKKKAALFWSLPKDDYDLWCSTPIEQWRQQVEVLWPELAPFVRQINDHKDMTMARYSHGQLIKPYADRLVFIGDSAHRASPQLGQGANMALLDAYALACAIEQQSLEKALPTYAKARRNHVMIYQFLSWAFTPMYQSKSKVLPILRDWIMAPLGRVFPFNRILTSLVNGTMVNACRKLGKDKPLINK